MAEAGHCPTVHPSMSRYISPIFVVKKKDGAFQLVQDFLALNTQTYPDRYSMRDVTDCNIHKIGKSGCTIFSTIDLTSGFWQMVLKLECREYTAFTVYGMGQYKFKTSPMGLLGCPALFQCLMEVVMKGIPNVLVYIDDILIYSRTHEEHCKILDAVFRRLAQHNLKIRLEKCCFATKEVEYLGFRLTTSIWFRPTDGINAETYCWLNILSFIKIRNYVQKFLGCTSSPGLRLRLILSYC